MSRLYVPDGLGGLKRVRTPGDAPVGSWSLVPARGHFRQGSEHFVDLGDSSIVEVSVTQQPNKRSWMPIVVVSGRPGFHTTHLLRGVHYVYVRRALNGPEAAAGQFIVT
jgi:hypothetical protein